MKNVLKVLKGSLGYASDVVGFIKDNPTITISSPHIEQLKKDYKAYL